MTSFSANLGFLWTDRPLPDAIRAAKAAGFVAVELHWPYDTPATDVRAALDETGLMVMGLNTRRGNVAAGENGLSALPGRETEAREAIDEAITYAVEIGAPNVHVMAGNAAGAEASAAIEAALHYACEQGELRGPGILIEPLNAHDAPNYFLRDTVQAEKVIAAVRADNLKLMFDCYHVGRTEGDVIDRLKALYPIVGHIQFAAVPDRGAPDHGEVDYTNVFSAIAALGWDRPLGAEYKPVGSTDLSLGWMGKLVA